VTALSAAKVATCQWPASPEKPQTGMQPVEPPNLKEEMDDEGLF
jgi:hypothetical protein